MLASLFVSCNLRKTSQLKQTDLVNLHSNLTSLSVQWSKDKDFGTVEKCDTTSRSRWEYLKQTYKLSFWNKNTSYKKIKSITLSS